MIYCIWYPSGGFGHFVNAILTLHGENFLRPKKEAMVFSSNGNSHALDLLVPKYHNNQWPGSNFIDNKNYCVLIDNGINDENEQFKSVFPNATVIKLCYSTHSWPIVAKTMIEKAMASNLDDQLPITEWNNNEPWAYREKYFLFLRDHYLRGHWQRKTDYNIDVLDLTDYNKLFFLLNSIVKTGNFFDLWSEWHIANQIYINPIYTAQKILSNVANKKFDDLTNIKDTWTQAVIYYYIWEKYQFEVPHNDYANWFTNTQEIVKMLEDHGVYH